MNEKIQNYLNKRKEEVALEREKEKQQLLENLKLGERVYSDNSTRTIEFPLYDDNLGSELKAYKIDSAQDLTEEDYEEIKKYSQKGYGITKVPGAWYTFATVMMVLGALGVVIALFVCLSEPFNRDYTPLIIALGGYLIELGLWAIVQLLAKIEANTRR